MTPQRFVVPSNAV